MSRLSSKIDSFKCAKDDEYLHHVLEIFHFGLIDCQLMEEDFLEIKECETDVGRYYLVENRAIGIRGFIGRDAHNGSAIFIVQDNARIKWAKKEGFIDSGMTYKQVWEKIGVLIHVNSVDDMIKFIGGQKGYLMIGKYLTGGDFTTEKSATG